MEEKQLNFNRPLLSVRRNSPAVTENKRKTENGNPRLPPLYKSELRSGPVRNPGTVPFVWEQSPGRPKYETKPQALDHQQAAPRLPPGRTPKSDAKPLDKVLEGSSETRNGVLGPQNASYSEKNETREESFGDGIEETGALNMVDDSEAYVDALDTLSRSESFFSNCSISGVSGLDAPDIKQWGSSLTDRQARDFMMGRFLPAAKAMASETPQYCPRKQTVQQEQSRMTNKLHTIEKRDPFSEGRRLTNVPHCNEEEKTEYEDGIMKAIANVRSSSSYDEIKDDVHKQATIHVLRSKGMQNEWKSQSNKIPSRNHEKKLDGPSLYKRLQGNTPFPYKERFSKPVISEGKRFLGVPEKSEVNGFSSNAKSGKLFRELLVAESNEWESASSSPLAEKTVYIDSENIPKFQISNSSSPDIKGEVTKNGEIEEKAPPFSSFVEDELVEKTNMLLKRVDSGDLGLRSVDDVKIVSVNSNQDPIDISTSEPSPKLDPITQSTKESFNLDMKLSDEEEISNGSTKFVLPLPPPLPKSPSESWLKRALPKHTALRSSLGLNLQPSKAESIDSKWETIVKSAKVQHGHLRHSEELLSTIPEV